MKKVTKKRIPVKISSGNLWADLGFPDAEERQAKSNLAIQIYLLVKNKNLTTVKTARLLKLKPSEVEKLFAGKLSGFPLEQLIQFLLTLDQDVTIKVTPKARTKKKARVHVSIPILKNSPMIKQNTKISETKTIHTKKAKK